LIKNYLFPLLVLEDELDDDLDPDEILLELVFDLKLDEL